MCANPFENTKAGGTEQDCVASAEHLNFDEMYMNSQPVFCSGFGQFHTNEPDPENPFRKLTPYTATTFATIRNLCDTPQEVEKSDAMWVIPSTVMSRTHDQQRAIGRYGLLVADLDKQDGLPLSGVAEAIRTIIFGRNFETYTTKSATPENQKARVVIELETQLDFPTWCEAQEMFFDQLESKGFKCDRSLSRAGQLFYLPNRGTYYQNLHERTSGKFAPIKFWGAELEARKATAAAEYNDAQTRKNAAALSRATRIATAAGDLSKLLPIDRYNLTNDVVPILLKHDYEESHRNPGNFKHPASETGSYSLQLTSNGGVFGLSSSDPLGRDKNAGHACSPFDVFCILEHGGDKGKALAAITRMAAMDDFMTPLSAEEAAERFDMGAGLRRKINAVVGVRESLLADAYIPVSPSMLINFITGRVATEQPDGLWSIGATHGIDGANYLCAKEFDGDVIKLHSSWNENAELYEHIHEPVALSATSVGKTLRKSNQHEHPHAAFISPETTDQRDDEYVLDQLICGAMTLIVGSSGVGKTTQLVPLMSIVAHLCRDDHPLKPELRRNVIYIAEDVNQVRKIIKSMRLSGWFGDITEAEVAERFKVVASRRLPAEVIAQAASIYTKLSVTNTNPKTGETIEAMPVVIYDTSNANIALKNENDNAEVGAAIAAFKEAFPAVRIPVIIVAHFGKAMRRGDLATASSRGASAFEADVSQVIYLVEDDLDPKKRWMEIGGAFTKHRFEASALGISFQYVQQRTMMLSALGTMCERVVAYGEPEVVTATQRAVEADAIKARNENLQIQQDTNILMRYLSELDTPVSKNAIEATQKGVISQKRVRAALAYMRQRGLIADDKDYTTEDKRTHHNGIIAIKADFDENIQSSETDFVTPLTDEA